jgi:hypothetical protein
VVRPTVTQATRFRSNQGEFREGDYEEIIKSVAPLF